MFKHSAAPVTTIAQKITRVFLFGSAILLLCYGLLFRTTILVTENKSSMHRLVIVAPHYLGLYQQGAKGVIKVDPLITAYENYDLLPEKIKQKIDKAWLGVNSIHFDDDSELAIAAQKVNNKVHYITENSDVTEWSDDHFLLIEVLILGCGLMLFFIAAIMIKNTAQKIAQPFSSLAKQLSLDDGETFEELSIKGTVTKELKQTLSAVNSYRTKIAQSIVREQSFTRYVSHELRTPMTVIKGSLSVLRKHSEEKHNKQYQRIDDAITEMQALTQTFLLLARDATKTTQEFSITQTLLEAQLESLGELATSSNCQVSIQVLDKVGFNIEPILFYALVKNLMINAINCSPNGKVSLFIDRQQLVVTDTGCGLAEDHRGYEGFGIGLVLVKDICEKYQWQFSLNDNEDKGCTAKVMFNNS